MLRVPPHRSGVDSLIDKRKHIRYFIARIYPRLYPLPPTLTDPERGQHRDHAPRPGPQTAKDRPLDPPALSIVRYQHPGPHLLYPSGELGRSSLTGPTGHDLRCCFFSSLFADFSRRRTAGLAPDATPIGANSPPSTGGACPPPGGSTGRGSGCSCGGGGGRVAVSGGGRGAT